MSVARFNGQEMTDIKTVWHSLRQPVLVLLRCEDDDCFGFFPLGSWSPSGPVGDPPLSGGRTWASIDRRLILRRLYMSLVYGTSVWLFLLALWWRALPLVDREDNDRRRTQGHAGEV